MGMFNSVYKSCPNDGCDGDLEFQTKAGSCTLASLGEDNISMSEAEDIDGDEACCMTCGTSYKLNVKAVIRPQFKFELEEL